MNGVACIGQSRKDIKGCDDGESIHSFFRHYLNTPFARESERVILIQGSFVKGELDMEYIKDRDASII